MPLHKVCTCMLVWVYYERTTDRTLLKLPRRLTLLSTLPRDDFFPTLWMVPRDVFFSDGGRPFCELNELDDFRRPRHPGGRGVLVYSNTNGRWGEGALHTGWAAERQPRRRHAPGVGVGSSSSISLRCVSLGCV